MSTLVEIERAVEGLPADEQEALWLFHDAARKWLDAAMGGAEPVARAFDA